MLKLPQQVAPDVAQRLFATPDGSALLDALVSEYVLAPLPLMSSEAALYYAGVRDAILMLLTASGEPTEK